MIILLSYTPEENTCSPREKGARKMKDEYIKKLIELIQKCDDVTLLDLILQLLQQSQEA